MAIKVNLLECTKNGEELISLAAKLCYSNSDIDSLREGLTKDSVERFITMLTNMGHESPTEHVSFSFAVEGISRITEIQLVRHRLASYSIQSGRYVKRDNPEFIIPPRIEKSNLAKSRFKIIAKQSMNAYNDLFMISMLEQLQFKERNISMMTEDMKINIIAELEETDRKRYLEYEKIAIEDARYAHLQSLGVKLIITMNVRSLNNFFAHRCCFRAQWEIRRLAIQMLALCKNEAPVLFANFGAACISGICPEGRMQCSELKGTIPTNLEVKELIRMYYNKK